MRITMSHLAIRAGRAVAVATLLGAFLSAVPLHQSRAQQAAQPMAAMTDHGKHQADRVEKRIKELHDKLQITAAQEVLWGNVAQVMRDNANAMHASITDRSTKLKTMTAVDDLKSFEIVADQHAEGLKRLIPTFATLYASMTPAQQKRADHVFSEHQHHMHR